MVTQKMRALYSVLAVLVCLCDVLESFRQVDKDPCKVISCDGGDRCVSFATVCDGAPCHRPVCLPARCVLPKKEGRCRARLRRWYFDATVLSCGVFHYGGCRGNRNRFISQHACERGCLLPTKS